MCFLKPSGYYFKFTWSYNYTNREILCTSYSVSLTISACKIIVQYYNQNINICIIYQFFWFLQFYLYVFVFFILWAILSHMWVHVSTTTVKIQNCSLPKGFFLLLFENQTSCPHPPTPLTLGNHYQFSIAIILSFQNYDINGISK